MTKQKPLATMLTVAAETHEEIKESLRPLPALVQATLALQDLPEDRRGDVVFLQAVYTQIQNFTFAPHDKSPSRDKIAELRKMCAGLSITRDNIKDYAQELMKINHKQKQNEVTGQRERYNKIRDLWLGLEKILESLPPLIKERQDERGAHQL